jgi:hypothetical protein
MSLQSVLKNAVITAFAAADDLVETVTYNQATGGTYNVTTGIGTPAVTTVSVDGLFTAYSFAERQNSDIQPEDHRIILKGDLGFVPNDTDTITRTDGTVWRIVNVTLLGTSEATPAGWDLQLRRPH